MTLLRSKYSSRRSLARQEAWRLTDSSGRLAMWLAQCPMVRRPSLTQSFFHRFRHIRIHLAVEVGDEHLLIRISGIQVVYGICHDE